MDLTTFLENNWFIIGIMISFGGFLITTTRKIDQYIQENKDRDNDLNNKLESFKTDIEASVNHKFGLVNNEISKINAILEEQESKREDNVERNKIMMQGIEATLRSLHDEGHNGPVTLSLQAIEEYKIRKSSE